MPESTFKERSSFPNPIQRKILQFFKEHPQAVETARGIATWIGSEPKAIQKALEELVNRRWLSTHQTSAVTGYALTRNERISSQIQEALEAG